YGIDRYIPVFQGPLDTPYHKRFYEEAVQRLKTVAPQAPLPDRYVQSNYEAMNCLKLGMEKSGFRGREDSDKLVEALEGLHMKAGDDFPQGDKFIRKEDHQAFVTEFIYQIEGGEYHLIEWVPAEKTVYPSMCNMSA
ncbi:MAG TPA: hypothetical protein VLX09_19725, partial [Stellaceae bacterium]|nr:hypothetical protein [Stellaceae bacterium]